MSTSTETGMPQRSGSLWQRTTGRNFRWICSVLLCAYAALAASIQASWGVAQAWPSLVRAVPASRVSIPTCMGAHDLRIEGGFLKLEGDVTYERVCITHGGLLIADGPLTLHAGVLFVDALSRISSDPPEVVTSDNCGQNGATASPLTLLVRTAIIEGPITASGGQGASDGCTTGADGQTGGAGGDIAIQALTLTVTAPISVTSGMGGYHTGKDGGPGGTVTLAVAPPAPTDLSTYVHVDGGLGDSDVQDALPGSTPHPGSVGQLHITSLGKAQQAALSPAPTPLLRALGTAPALVQPQGMADFSRGLACGSGDLDIGAGQQRALHGTAIYPHVCVHDGGKLRAAPRLTLIADTISVDANSTIDADGLITATTAITSTGQYRAGSDPRAGPPAGVPGAKGADDGTDPSSDYFVEGPAGGPGGGSLTLIARQVLIAGTVSTNGANGIAGAGAAVGRHTGNTVGTGNAGGGSGGGLLVVAGSLQVTGTLSVLGGNAGGANGVAEYQDAASQPSGSPGQITVLVDRLATPTGDLPILGPGCLGHTLPIDPVPPSANGRYFAVVGHTLSGPFLARWQQLGGLDMLGLPRTEPFGEHGTTVQYTDRGLLVLDHGQVHLASLGRQITQGRTIASIAPVSTSATLRYFPDTQHSLSGRYLAFWQAHNGATLLGAPLSEVMREENGDGSHRRYAVQWFERGCLEYHSEHAGTRYALQLGLLGVAALQQRGWLPSR